MQIVIDIPEEDYNLIKKQVAVGIINPLKICIAKGTPLPKGHGDLVCKQSVINIIANTSFWISSSNWEEVMGTLDNVEPIIKADKE